MNELRRENNLPALDIHTVDLLEAIPEHLDDEEEEKISSSNRRMRLLGTRLRVPEVVVLLTFIWPVSSLNLSWNTRFPFFPVGSCWDNPQMRP